MRYIHSNSYLHSNMNSNMNSKNSKNNNIIYNYSIFIIHNIVIDILLL